MLDAAAPTTNTAEVSLAIGFFFGAGKMYRMWHSTGIGLTIGTNGCDDVVELVVSTSCGASLSLSRGLRHDAADRELDDWSLATTM